MRSTGWCSKVQSRETHYTRLRKAKSGKKKKKKALQDIMINKLGARRVTQSVSLNVNKKKKKERKEKVLKYLSASDPKLLTKCIIYNNNLFIIL